MKGTKRPRPVVTTDGDGVVSHAGSYLLVELADRVGLTAALSRGLACLKQRRRAHAPVRCCVTSLAASPTVGTASPT